MLAELQPWRRQVRLSVASVCCCAHVCVWLCAVCMCVVCANRHLWVGTEDGPDDIETEAKRAPLGASEELAWRIDRDSQLREATEHRRKVCIDWASARGLSLATVQEIYVFLLELIAAECVTRCPL